MSWQSTRLKFVAPLHRLIIDPCSLGLTEVDHYSIPAFDETGQPIRQAASEIGSAKLSVPPNAVLVSKLNPALPRVWLPAVNKLPSLASTEFVVLKPCPDLDRAYLAYVLRSRPAIEWFVQRAEGSTRSRQRVSPDVVADLPVQLPSTITQRAITAYLDRETKRIDRTVRSLQRLSSLLDEVLLVSIRNRITAASGHEEGEAGRQPTTYEWAGTVPTSWSKCKVAWSFRRIGSGTTPPTDRREYFDGGIPWVNSADLRDGPIYETPNFVTNEAVADFPALVIYPPGTLLVAMYGATIGRLGILAVPATINQACCALVDGTRLNACFTYYWLLALREHVVRLAEGGGQPNISQALVRQLVIHAPDLSEQRRIVTDIEAIQTRIDCLRLKVADQVRLLTERRLSLITGAITGEIDVTTPEAG